jgi:hypothetical protein
MAQPFKAGWGGRGIKIRQGRENDFAVPDGIWRLGGRNPTAKSVGYFQKAGGMRGMARNYFTFFKVYSIGSFIRIDI